MFVECLQCEQESEVESENLPDRACDDADYTCLHCGHVFLIGWYAEVELR